MFGRKDDDKRGPSGLRLRVSVLWNVLFGCHCTLRLRGRILYFSDMRF